MSTLDRCRYLLITGFGFRQQVQEYVAIPRLTLQLGGITIQNEPMAVQRWESCIYTAEDERDFLRDHLGPTMEREGLGEKKIIVWDHNRDLISHRANTILEDPEAAKYVWGVGFHWYEPWAGGEMMWWMAVAAAAELVALEPVVDLGVVYVGEEVAFEVPLHADGAASVPSLLYE